jgi:hypothetical protein
MIIFLSFNNYQMIKKKVDLLIDKEYLERDSDDINLIRYLA